MFRLLPGILLLLLFFSCRKLLLGPESNCPELTDRYVQISTDNLTGYQGWMKAYAEFPGCSEYNVQTKSAVKDSGASFITSGYFYGPPDSTTVHIERTQGNGPIVIWYWQGDRRDTLQPGVMVYDVTR